MLDLLREENLTQSTLFYDYSLVADEYREAVRGAARDIKGIGVRVKESMMSIGQRLLDVKELLPHGQFQVWIETEFDLSYRTAAEWMNVARRFYGKSAPGALLTESAMRLLSAPSVPEAALEAAIVEAEATGASPTKARVQAIIDQYKLQTVAGQCEVCHRPLTDPDHVAQGFGPVCAAKRAAVVEPDPDDDLEPTSPGVADSGDIDEDDDLPPAWRPPAPELTPHQKRTRRAREIFDLWQAALNTLPEVGELAGYYKRDPIHLAVNPMLEALRGNL